MLSKVRIQTAEGIRELPFVPSAAALKAAADAGEISVGQELVYRGHIVLMVAEDEMIMLADATPVYGGGAGPQWVPGADEAWRMFTPNMNNAQFSFTVNGVPVDPSQFMNGGKKTE